MIGLNVSGNLDIPTTLCSGCELGKFPRSPLKIGRNRENRIGELIYSDVWGPIASISISDANLHEDMPVHVSKVINRDEIPSTTTTHQRDEDSPPRVCASQLVNQSIARDSSNGNNL